MPTTTLGTVIITGSNGVLGLSLARQLVQSYPEYNVILTVRNASNDDENTAKLRRIIANARNIEVQRLDLGSLQNVRDFTTSIIDRIQSGALPHISAIICNAFAWTLQGQNFSEDGYELGFQITYLSHFLLVQVLLGQMQPPGTNARVVMLSSQAHDGSIKQIVPIPTQLPENIEALVKPAPDIPGTEFASGYARYGLSKLCNVMFTHCLGRHTSQAPALSHIKVLAMDPGGMPSHAARSAPLLLRIFLCYILPLFIYIIAPFTNTFRHVDDSARSLLELALSAIDNEGGYFVGSGKAKSSRSSYDFAEQERLWESSIKWTGLDKTEKGIAFPGQK